MVFVGSYTPDGLAVADHDPSTGALTITSTVAGVSDASWLALSPDGRHLYAANETAAGSVTVLDAKTLAVREAWPTGGDSPTHVSAFGEYLLVAHYGSGDVTVLRADGQVTCRAPGVHAHQVGADPSGQWVVTVDLGTDSVDVYRLADGTLHRHQRVSAGPGPRHLVWHPDGTRAFLVCEYAAQVIVCTWDAGTLTTGAVLPLAADGYPGEAVVSSDGRFLYVTNRGPNTVDTFELDDLRLVDSVPTGDWPRHAALDPSERWLYVANQRSGTVTWFPRDPVSGRLSPEVGSMKAEAVAMVLFG
ncbi:MAG TPA: lactonase family protein [Pseudonocardiaceae bacterium]|nr:lactonase family protein [Pseudonocardiaceae bacterium]